MRVLITRPQDDASALAARLSALGVDSLIEPLLDIVFLETNLPDLSDVQGLLVTSANGLRAFAKASPRRDIAVWAVGDASARAAHDAGFTSVNSAVGDVESLAELVIAQADAADGEFLHVAGTRLAGDLGGRLQAAGFGYARCVLYEAQTASALSDAAVTQLQTGALDGVLLYSPRTAATFVELLDAARLAGALHKVTAFCLSAAVAEKITGLEWARVAVATTPDENALIDILAPE